ncbi:hypothetical protein FSARC_3480 [Fusarium sarcochroum]|uniref:Uncharacterized protein n=1 Tax=Fusarium sarcochroum TaxID=1208366 RepID=A0A8H4XBT2_9HYPO|nr:hypothetical protein FSARC_3480 [Fusarium sarcochroum]
MPHNAPDNDVSVNDYHLNGEDFEAEVLKRYPTWRREQVKKVLSSFEKAKSVMSLQAIQEIHKYLSTGRWINDAFHACRHPAYMHLRGQRPHDFEKQQFYYPYFLVVQAIYPRSDGVEKIAIGLSQHWGIPFDWTEPWYPRLDDPAREHALIMGQGLDVSEITRNSSSASNPLATESSSSCITVSRNPKTDETQPEPQNQPNSADNGNTLGDYNNKLASIRADFDQRLTEIQSQLQVDTTRSDADKAHYHVTKAKDLAKEANQLAKQADHHATVALEAVESLMERLNGNSKQPASNDANNGRASKRARKN